MSNFNSRIAAGAKFEDDVERFCCEMFNSVARNGTEHTHPVFVELLRRNNSEASKFVRFAPDGVMLSANGSVFHWEAKASKAIEKDAYDTYLKYTTMGCNVLMFVKNPKNKIVYWQRVERVGFIPSAVVVGGFPENKRHPIDDDDWLCPRNGHGNAGFGSGTPYREIDFGSLKPIPDFNAVVGQSPK